MPNETNQPTTPDPRDCKVCRQDEENCVCDNCEMCGERAEHCCCEPEPKSPEPKNWQVDDIVQITTPDSCFAGCMLIVTVRDTEGVLGYVQLPDRKTIRVWARWNEGVRIGKIETVKKALNKDETTPEPKSPDGYETWLHYFLGEINQRQFSYDSLENARAEYAKLRKDAATLNHANEALQETSRAGWDAYHRLKLIFEAAVNRADELDSEINWECHEGKGEYDKLCAELAKLREEARKYREGTTTPLRDGPNIPMMFIREDRWSEITADAEKWRAIEPALKTFGLVLVDILEPFWDNDNAIH